MIRYLSDRFHYQETALVRQGDTVYDLKTRRKRKIMLGQKRKKKVSPSPDRMKWTRWPAGADVEPQHLISGGGAG